jgi:hypothetical protein
MDLMGMIGSSRRVIGDITASTLLIGLIFDVGGATNMATATAIGGAVAVSRAMEMSTMVTGGDHGMQCAPVIGLDLRWTIGCRLLTTIIG